MDTALPRIHLPARTQTFLSQTNSEISPPSNCADHCNVSHVFRICNFRKRCAMGTVARPTFIKNHLSNSKRQRKTTQLDNHPCNHTQDRFLARSWNGFDSRDKKIIDQLKCHTTSMKRSVFIIKVVERVPDHVGRIMSCRFSQTDIP